MSNHPRVFVTQEVLRNDLNGHKRPAFDLTPAAHFGEIVICCPPDFSVISSVPVVRLMREKLRDFTEDDFLLPAGDPGIMAIAAMLAGRRTGGRLKVLRWDRRERVYIPVVIDLSGEAIGDAQ